MDIAELIEIALANSDGQRVEVAALEGAEIEMEAVSGLAQLVAELVENAIAFSEPDDVVRVTGLHDQGDYLISISDRGVGLPDDLMSELNRVLEDPNSAEGPEPKLGIALVARLAARNGITVRLVPGAPGTTARVTIPARLVGEPRPKQAEEPARSAEHRLPPRPPQRNDVFARAEDVEEMVDLTRFERASGTRSGVVAMTEDAKREAEAFLARVFAPLVERPGVAERPAPGPATPPNGNGHPAPSPSEPPAPPAREERQGGTVTALRVRVPGQNFSLEEDDPSILAGERAIDIRTALSKYAAGRRSAEEEAEG